MTKFPCSIEDLPTPCLLLRRSRLADNCRKMAERMIEKGVNLRPHLKTAKSIDVARVATAGHSGSITVSTVAEVLYFAAEGVVDILYAVGIVPRKLSRLVDAINAGARVTCIIDNLDLVEPLNAHAQKLGITLPLLIELDVGGLRGGLASREQLLALASSIAAASHLLFDGVMTHAGHSYSSTNLEEVKAVAEMERSGLVMASDFLSDNDLPCRIVSGGSTPTAVHGESFEGLTEMRPGVYTFQDLDQHGLGSCAVNDIAVSVLTSVVGHNPRVGRILTDAGGLALSKDVSAKKFLANTGYGWVAGVEGSLCAEGLYVSEVHQEHGLLAVPDGDLDYSEHPVGTVLTILPNHICMTAAAYDGYYVVENDGQVTEFWPRINGW